ncbi:MAG: response regulator [Lachnospiraceae bacterium]|nr:response regulator [Lachnospiraceae bacterium]
MINILAIDDDQETLDTIRLYLTDTADVTCVSSGKQALQQVHMQRYDVILLDIEMPIMNGFVTLEKLRNIEDCVNIPVVMLTGKQDKYYVMNSIALGIDGYLLKPVTKKDLIDKVLEVCQKKHQHHDTKTILAIDDDMSYLKQLNSFLKDYYNVIMINTTKLALDYLTNYVPDLIILDYQMPLYNGVALINMIRQNDRLKDIPVLVLSGYLNEQVLVEFYPYNPVACLAKTVGKDVLLEKIAMALGQSTDEES